MNLCLDLHLATCSQSFTWWMQSYGPTSPSHPSPTSLLYCQRRGTPPCSSGSCETVFVPSDEAIHRFLAESNLPLSALTGKRRAAAAFIRAHCVDSSPASAPALFLLDLITLASDDALNMTYLGGGKPNPVPGLLAGLDGEPRKTYIYNLDGSGMLEVET